jgi:predicted dehydrogenase
MFNLTPSFVGNQDGFQYKVQHFIDCIRTGCPCEAPGEDGLAVQKMLDAIYRSAETRQVVPIR